MCRGLDTITWAGPVSVPALSGKGMEGNSLNNAQFPPSLTSKIRSNMLVCSILIQSQVYCRFLEERCYVRFVGIRECSQSKVLPVLYG